MQDQPTPPDPAADLDQAEHVILLLLLDTGSRWPWSVAELGLALGSHPAAQDAVVELHAAGLVHRLHEFVFPTRGAERYRQLAAAGP
jgi:hypothetical protein